MLESSEREIISGLCRIGFAGGMVCPRCGQVISWVTYDHAKKHGTTRDKLRSECKAFGNLRDVERVIKRRRADKNENN